MEPKTAETPSEAKAPTLVQTPTLIAITATLFLLIAGSYVLSVIFFLNQRDSAETNLQDTSDLAASTTTAPTFDDIDLQILQDQIDEIIAQQNDFLTEDSFLTEDVQEAILDVVPEGEQGEKGDKGDTGASGTNGVITEVARFYASADVSAGTSGSAIAVCGAGYHLIAGGCRIQAYVTPDNVALTQTYPAGDSWFCYVDNLSAQNVQLQGTVICYR